MSFKGVNMAVAKGVEWSSSNQNPSLPHLHCMNVCVNG